MLGLLARWRSKYQWPISPCPCVCIQRARDTVVLKYKTYKNCVVYTRTTALNRYGGIKLDFFGGSGNENRSTMVTNDFQCVSLCVYACCVCV